jgi:putative tricarboxylic transport membrane protein
VADKLTALKIHKSYLQLCWKSEVVAMPKFNNEQASSVVWFVIGLIIVILSIRMDIGSFLSPAAGFMPLLAGSAMCVFSLIGFLHGTFARKHGVEWKPIVKNLQWERALIVIAALCAYAYLLDKIGFLICTLIFIGVLFRAVKPLKWSVVILGSVLTTAIAFLIFDVWLKSQLPKGPWGF